MHVIESLHKHITLSYTALMFRVTVSKWSFQQRSQHSTGLCNWI